MKAPAVRIIPVIDLKNGQVVRGVGGRRHEYRPVETVLTGDASPAGIARAFAARFGFEEVYVADLDAIAGADPNWQTYQAIARCGSRLWVDAGAGTLERARQLASFDGASIATIVIGLETLEAPGELAAIVAACGAQRVAFSLDLKDGRPITRIPSWQDVAPEQMAAAAAQAGVRKMIVLDLAHVGEGRGPGAADLCRRLHERLPEVELIGGGGVRGAADCRILAGAGCQGVLVASALHDGRLTAADLQTLRW
jgi:phosphoribosylformimino-5-aminoimidazole carboxamide ribotide isomerase